jgi:hypothetical protein
VGGGVGRDRTSGRPIRWHAALGLALLCTGLAACVETGDFGRPKPTFWSEVVLPTAGAVAAQRRGEPVSAFPFTDDEEELRDRSWRFVMPAYERASFDAQISELVRTRVLPASDHPFEITAYYRALMSEWFASPASRFRRIGEDAEADLLLIDPFAAVAARVIAADQARLRSLAFVRDLAEGQVYDAAARVAENRCLIAWVRAELYGRTEAYRYALEQAFIAMPQYQAVGAERAIKALDIHRRSLDTLPVPPWRNGACLIPTIGPLPTVGPRVKVPRPLVVKG